jgi:phosphoenolpyruvate-protein kinase (PTS system EI component)
MAEHILRGAPASPGVAAGAARVLDKPRATPARTATGVERTGPGDRAAGGERPAGVERSAVGERSTEPPQPVEAERVLDALRAAAAEIERLAARLRTEGREAEAEIVATGALMAADPGLQADAQAGVRERGLSAPDALLEAAERHAAAIAALDDATLAARADDVRSLGRRAARLAHGRPSPETLPADVVLVARDFGPADVAELGPEVKAVLLAAGAVTAHAAIVARSLGLPMVVCAGEEVLAVADGKPLVVEAGDGLAVLDPDPARLELARAAADARRREQALAREHRALPAETRDGRRVRVLANAVSRAEVAAALEAGAEGAGLIRTELAFLDAGEWPGEAAHRAALEPVLDALAGLTATVRVLDYGGDKLPPFLRGARERGIGLLLANPDALAAQLRAVVAAGAGSRLRLLLPLVSGPEQVRTVRELAREAARSAGAAETPPIGAMVELPVAAERAAELAAEADFLSIGTNDLTASTLGVDRFAAGEAPAHHPRVLAHVARTVRAAHAAGIPVEVCGEAASDPVSLPLLVGLGADELSVGAARVGAVRAQVRDLSFGAAAALAERALAAPDAAAVEQLTRSPEPAGSASR